MKAVYLEDAESEQDGFYWWMLPVLSASLGVVIVLVCLAIVKTRKAPKTKGLKKEAGNDAD